MACQLRLRDRGIFGADRRNRPEAQPKRTRCPDAESNSFELARCFGHQVADWAETRTRLYGLNLPTAQIESRMRAMMPDAGDELGIEALICSLRGDAESCFEVHAGTTKNR